MINVLHLRDTDRVCGPGKTIIETACAAGDGFVHKIGLLLLQREHHNLYQEVALKRGVEVIPIRSSHQFDPRVIGRIIETVKAHRINIIHSHDYKSDLLTWTVRRFHRVPIMTTVHGWIRHNLKRKLYIRAGQVVLPSFQRIVAVSEETRSAVLACGVPTSKVTVIHNGVVMENYRRDAHEPGYLRQRFNLSAGASLVGYVGRLSPEKGQSDLLEAAVRLIPSQPHLAIVLVGDGPDRRSLEARATALGIGARVHFTGHLQDVRPALRDLDILALTSHTEGFPNVVLEALCMGVPVLANDVGGVREIIEDGVTGVLLPPRSPERIADGLRRLLDQPAWARALAVNGNRLVRERFTFQARVAKEEALCLEILKDGLP